MQPYQQIISDIISCFLVINTDYHVGDIYVLKFCTIWELFLHKQAVLNLTSLGFIYFSHQCFQISIFFVVPKNSSIYLDWWDLNLDDLGATHTHRNTLFTLVGGVIMKDMMVLVQNYLLRYQFLSLHINNVPKLC